MDIITPKKEYDLNNMNVSAQQIHMGTYLKELATNTAGSGFINSGCGIIGIPSNTVFIDNNGFMTFSGSARYWDDLFFPIQSGRQGALDQPPYNYNEVAVDFPQNNNTQKMYGVIQFPHSWAIGTNIYPHVHWKQWQSGSVVWKIDYKWFDIGGTVPASFTTYTMNIPSILWSSGSIQQISSGSAPISGSHISGVSSLLIMTLYRDDSTYAGPASAYHFDIHILKDSLGSHSIYNK